MRWDAVVEGQPPSLNHIYQTRTRQVKRAGRPIFKGDGSPAMQTYRALTSEAEAYRDGAQMILQTRVPSRWKPEGQIRILFDFALSRDIDDDNILKLLYDAMKEAIGYDDKHYLHCIRTKETGHARPFVFITVDDDPTHC